MLVHEVRSEVGQILDQPIASYVIVVELDEITSLKEAILVRVATAHDGN